MTRVRAAMAGEPLSGLRRRAAPGLRGSANLRTNKNVEQVTAINDAGLHDWQAAWIDAKVREHEVNQSGSRQTG
jgi:hypothetical protein